MNLFRSEEDARRWAEFVPGSDAGIVTLGHYVSSAPGYTAVFFAAA